MFQNASTLYKIVPLELICFLSQTETENACLSSLRQTQPSLDKLIGTEKYIGTKIGGYMPFRMERYRDRETNLPK